MSGFSIFLLIQAREGLEHVFTHILLHYHLNALILGATYLFWGILMLSCYALIISLVVHILARGFWIGLIGLRSVQPQVDFKRLRYAPRFESHLKEKLPTLDRLLIRLDRISSAIFSFTFLIICMLLSIVAWFIVTLPIQYAVNELSAGYDDPLLYRILNYMAVLVMLLHTVASLLYMIDTLWIGVIKRIKWFSKIYKPIYQYANFITLSFLYRSVYYHLVGYLGVWKSRVLFHTFIFAMLLSPFIRFDQEIFYPDQSPDNEVFSYYYDDMRGKSEEIKDAAIHSSIVQGNALPLFLRYSTYQNETLLHICDYTKPKIRVFTRNSN